MNRAGDCVGNRAVAGTAAEIAFERPRQRGALRLIQAGGRHDHAGGAKAALKPLGRQELRLHWVQRAILRRQSLDRGDLLSLGTMRRIQT
jgi:hypothetical protein